MASRRSRQAHELLVDILFVFEMHGAMKRLEYADILSKLASEGIGDLSFQSTLGLSARTSLTPLPPSADWWDIEWNSAAADLVMQMTFCRMVDSFQTYLTEILLEISRRRPEVLKSGQHSVRVADIVEFGTMDDLLAFLAEQRANALSRDGYGALVTFLRKHVGEPLFDDEEQEERLCLYIDVRNLFVHHRGRVHKRFADKWSHEEDVVVDNLFPLRERFVKNAASDLIRVGANIDELAMNKFGVPVFEA